MSTTLNFKKQLKPHFDESEKIEVASKKKPDKKDVSYTLKLLRIIELLSEQQNVDIAIQNK